MKSFNLGFAEIIKLSERIAEVIIGEGVDVDIEKANTLYQWFRENLPDPCFILVNRKHSYSLSFETQMALGEHKQLRATAAVAYDLSSEATSKHLVKMRRDRDWSFKVFRDRDESLKWLEEQQEIALAHLDS